MTTNNYYPAPAPAGRERTCGHCSRVYRSPRSTSRYCGPLCRKKAHRRESVEAAAVLLRKRLLHLDLIGHATEADRSAGILALTVPREIALAEINRRYNRPATLAAGQFRVSLKEALAADAAKVRPDLSEAEFASLLTAAGIRPYHQHSPILAESRRIDCSARRDLAQREASR